MPVTQTLEQGGVKEKIAEFVGKLTLPDTFATLIINALGVEHAELFTYYVAIDGKIKALLYEKLKKAGYPHVVIVSLGKSDDAFSGFPYTYQIVTGESNSRKAEQYMQTIITILKRATKDTDIELDYSLDAAIFFVGLKTTNRILVHKTKTKK